MLLERPVSECCLRATNKTFVCLRDSEPLSVNTHWRLLPNWIWLCWLRSYQPARLVQRKFRLYLFRVPVFAKRQPRTIESCPVKGNHKVGTLFFRANLLGSLLRQNGSKNKNALRTLLHIPAKLPPCLIASNPSCVGPLRCDKHDVVKAVAMEPRHCSKILLQLLTVAPFQGLAKLLDCRRLALLPRLSCLSSCFGELLLPSQAAGGAIPKRGTKAERWLRPDRNEWQAE